MKTIGLIGGVSWESTAVYYRILNELAKSAMGETHSCPLLLYSFDFDPLRTLSFKEEWDTVGEMISEQAVRLEQAGAECLLICANTMHIVADAVAARTSVPIIHLVDATAECAKAQGMSKVGLLGTRYTMNGSFYGGRMEEQHGLEVLVPGPQDQQFVNAAIYDELVLGRFESATRNRMAHIISSLVARGAQGIILGCTELPMLLRPEDAKVPLLDTTLVHCQAAVAFALSH
jgi:aspartate racemase